MSCGTVSPTFAEALTAQHIHTNATNVLNIAAVGLSQRLQRLYRLTLNFVDLVNNEPDTERDNYYYE